MKSVKYNIKVNILSPFNISSGEDGGGFIDKYTVKINNKPYIPATTIKGLIKHSFYKISDFKHDAKNCSCPVCRLFGKEGYYPSKIYIDDLKTNEEKRTRIKFGNAIDRYRKTAKDNALYSKEIVCNRQFNGQATVYFDEETIKYKEQFELAVKMIDAIGNGSSRGHGHVVVNIEEVK